MRFQAVRLIGALAVLFMVSGAWGASIEWTLSSVTFDDGGTATGTFEYDWNTNTYSAINILTAGGNTSLFGGTASAAETSNAINYNSTIYGCPSVPSEVCNLTLWFDEQLINAGGFKSIDLNSASNEFDSSST